MGARNLKIMTVLLIAVLLIGVFFLFAPHLFAPGGPNPLPLPSASRSPNSAPPLSSLHPSSSFSPTPSIEPIAVTVDNAQKLLATLPHIREYGGLWTLTRYWQQNGQPTSHAITCRIWERDGYVRVETAEVGQPIQYLLQGTNWVFKWSENIKDRVISYAIGNINAEQNTQIPAIELLFSLSQEDIADADFVYMDDVPCLYLALSPPGSPYEDLYWISWENRLLYRYERRKEGVLHLQATLTQINTERPSDELFTLPSNQPLEEVDINPAAD